MLRQKVTQVDVVRASHRVRVDLAEHKVASEEQLLRRREAALSHTELRWARGITTLVLFLSRSRENAKGVNQAEVVEPAVCHARVQ